MASVWDDIKAIDVNFSALKMIAMSSNQNSHCGSALLVSFTGELYGLGENTNGCLALQSNETCIPEKVLELSTFSGVSVCTMYGDALAYTREGKLYVWGANVYENTCTKPVLLENLPNIVDAKCIAGHYLALTDKGKVYEWRGMKTSVREFNELNTVPTIVEFKETIVAIACGAHHSLVVTKYGDVHSFGYRFPIRSSELHIFKNISLKGFSSVSKVTIPGEIIIKVACGDSHSLSLTQSGRIYVWGFNQWGLGDDESKLESDTPLRVGGNIGRFKDISTNGVWTNAAITDEGAVYMWGMNERKKKVTKPLLTQCTEMQQVFSEIKNSTCAWSYRDSYCMAADRSAFFIKEIATTFNKEDFSDLTLLVGRKKIYVHKYILQLRSEFFFRTLLEERWNNKHIRQIELKCYDYEVYLSYLWYLYSREIKTSSEHIIDLWDLAVAYGEEKLELGCETLINKNMTTKTILKNKLRTRRYSLPEIINSELLEEKINKLKADYEMQCQTIKDEYINSLEKLKNEYKVSQERDTPEFVRLSALLESEVLKTDPGVNELKLKAAKLKEDFTKLENNYLELERENLELRLLRKVLEEDNLKLGEKISKLKCDQTNSKIIHTKLDGLYTILQQTFKIPAGNSANPEAVNSERVAEVGKSVDGTPEAINLKETEVGKETHKNSETEQPEIKGTDIKTLLCQSEIKVNQGEDNHMEIEEILDEGELFYKKLEEDYAELQKINTKLEKEKANLEEEYNKLEEKHKRLQIFYNENDVKDEHKE